MFKAYFSPSNDCLNAIIEEIQKAKKTIDICVFTISDNRISKEIINAKKRKVEVRIITDNDKKLDRGSDIDFLQKNGIKIKFDSTEAHMHHKFALIDKKTLINGSYNWTVSAADYNYENIIVTNNCKARRLFLKEFERMWKKFV